MSSTETTRCTGPSVVVVVRDPDYANHHEVYEGDEPGVVTFDLDYGQGDLRDPDEAAEYAAAWREDAATLPEGHPARAFIEDAANDLPTGD